MNNLAVEMTLDLKDVQVNLETLNSKRLLQTSMLRLL